MVIAIRQTCPKCHTSFMGSDCIGGLCDNCEKIPIQMEAPMLTPAKLIELRTSAQNYHLGIRDLGAEAALLDAALGLLNMVEPLVMESRPVSTDEGKQDFFRRKASVSVANLLFDVMYRKGIGPAELSEISGVPLYELNGILGHHTDVDLRTLSDLLTYMDSMLLIHDTAHPKYEQPKKSEPKNQVEYISPGQTDKT